MTYLIDAWLDRPHPYLRILHRETGEICAVLEEDALDELRDQGGLDLHELNSSEPLILKEPGTQPVPLLLRPRPALSLCDDARTRHPCAAAREADRTNGGKGASGRFREGHGRPSRSHFPHVPVFPQRLARARRQPLAAIGIPA